MYRQTRAAVGVPGRMVVVRPLPVFLTSRAFPRVTGQGEELLR
jgi:hypothetical protein